VVGGIHTIAPHPDKTYFATSGECLAQCPYSRWSDTKLGSARAVVEGCGHFQHGVNGTDVDSPRTHRLAFWDVLAGQGSSSHRLKGHNGEDIICHKLVSPGMIAVAAGSVMVSETARGDIDELSEVNMQSHRNLPYRQGEHCLWPHVSPDTALMCSLLLPSLLPSSRFVLSLSIVIGESLLPLGNRGIYSPGTQPHSNPRQRQVSMEASQWTALSCNSLCVLLAGDDGWDAGSGVLLCR
jgi:hypothetical protein